MAARRTVTRSTGRDSGIQKYYVDALGKRHAAPRDTVRAIERAMTAGPAIRRPRRARRPRRLEDVASGRPRSVSRTAASLAIDRELPADLPARLPRARRPDAASRVRLIVAPATCHLPADFAHVGLGDSALCRALAAQLGHRRSRRSALAGPLGARAGRRHRADQPAGRGGPDACRSSRARISLRAGGSATRCICASKRSTGARDAGRRPRSGPRRPSRSIAIG